MKKEHVPCSAGETPAIQRTGEFAGLDASRIQQDFEVLKKEHVPCSAGETPAIQRTGEFAG
ncbi:MAG: hypothetical protein WC944_10830, partial [Candidatus Cloacimonadaceae bacterium]